MPAPALALDTTVKLLQKIPIFAELSERALSSLAQQTTTERFERDAVVFFQGDPCDRIWLVHQGQVKIVYHEEDGREIILEIISAGEAFGGAVLFFPSHPATAKAIEDSLLVSFTSEAYSQFLKNNPEVSLKLLHMLGKRHLSMLNMQILAGERVERRMAHILLKLAVRLGRPEQEGLMITIPLSRQDLADMSCTTLETAIRTISRFAHDGLVSTQRGGYILITDLDGLEKLTH